MGNSLRQLYWISCYYMLLLCFAIGIYAVNVVSLFMTFLLHPENARAILRRIVHHLFRLYVNSMTASGILRANFSLLDKLGGGEGGRLIIANHPSILDAPIFLSRIPGLGCVFKSTLKRRFTMEQTARILGYFSNDEGIGLLKEIVLRLRAGEQLLVFPEGTRTSGDCLDPLNPGYALAAMRAQVPVQIVRIRTDSPLLSKQQPFYKPARFPITVCLDMGPCIEPGTFRTVNEFNAFVENWFKTRIPNPDPLKWSFLPVLTDYASSPEEGIRARFKVPEDPFYCHGHMPGNPIVPGYVQMAWVNEIRGSQELPALDFFRWKFLKPILPGDSVTVIIEPTAEKRGVRILKGEDLMTQGKLLQARGDKERPA